MGTFVLKRKTFNIPPNIGNVLKGHMGNMESIAKKAGEAAGTIRNNFNTQMNQLAKQTEQTMSNKVQEVAGSIKQTNNAMGTKASEEVGKMVGVANAGVERNMANGMKNAMNNGQV
jgi:hypothetical protein